MISITIFCYTIIFSSLFYLIELEYEIDNDMRNFTLQSIEKQNIKYTQTVNIYIEKLNNNKKKSAKLGEYIKSVVSAITFYILVLLLTLFLKELYTKDFLKSINEY